MNMNNFVIQDITR